MKRFMASASSRTITPVEVIEDIGKTVLVSGEHDPSGHARRERKRSKDLLYADTWEEAKQFLVDHYQEKINDPRPTPWIYERYLDEVQKLEPHD